MNDDQLKDMVIGHDKALDKLTDMSKNIDKLMELLPEIGIMNERIIHMDRQFAEAFDDMKARVAKVESGIEMLEKELPKKVAYSFLQWALVIVAGSMISFGTYLVDSIHELDTQLSTHTEVDNQIAETLSIQLNKIEAKIDRNHQ